MSMLAERKVKQKWSLNPRGKVWSEDPNKFGQKMLEKMGWSRGKGLGAREDGIVEHLKVSYKNDSKGMGYKDRNDQWTEHDANFNALLETLSGKKSEENETKVSSLEEKSQSSRVRLHYKKFTRGKDLSKWSEKDIANIFGRKTLKEEKVKRDESEKNEEEIDENNVGFARNSGSMVDYFKKKLPNFGKNSGYVVGSNGVLEKNSEDSDEQARVGFGFRVVKSDSEGEGRIGLGFEKKRKCNETTMNGTPKKLKKEESTEVEEQNKKNKKKKKIEETKEGTGLSNPAFDPLFNNIEIEKHVLNTIEEEEDNNEEEEETPREVKKKKKTMNNTCFDASVDCQTVSINDTFEVKRKEKKKSSDIDNADFEDYSQNEFEVKKKKKRKIDNNGLENPNFDENARDNSCQNNQLEVKKKKKVKDSLKIDNSIKGLDNPNFDENATEDSCQNNQFEVRKKKKDKETSRIDNSDFDSSETSKKRENEINGFLNPNFDNNTEESTCQNNEYEVKRKKKKKNNKDDSLALDNPVFDSLNDCQDSYVDSNYEVKRKKKKKQEEEENEPSFDLILNVTSTPSVSKSEAVKKFSVTRRKSVRFSDLNEERIIPNSEDIENRNELFDINSRIIENGLKDSTNLDLDENIDEISKKIDGFQNEIENEINEEKANKFIGEVGDPNGENEKLPNGTKLKFKYATFGKSPYYMHKTTTKAKTSYKHLIKGDIILGFNNTNLHEIMGYGVKNKKVKN